MLDVPVATVRLTRTEIITQRDFRAKVAEIERANRGTALTSAEKTELLNLLIAEALVAQAAERANIRISETEIIQAGRAQTGVNVSDQDFKTLVERQAGVTWAQYVETARKTLSAQRFVLADPGASSLQQVNITDAAIVTFFDENKSKFINPDLVRVSHVFLDTRRAPRLPVPDLQRLAAETQRAIAGNTLTFEEAVRRESDDKTSAARNGDLGFLRRDDPQLQAIFGRDFLNSVFRLRKGELSGVLESNLGLHIVRVTEKFDQRFLGLDDPVSPADTTTVRALIRQQLTAQAQQAAFQTLLNSIVERLRREAEVRTFAQNF